MRAVSTVGMTLAALWLVLAGLAGSTNPADAAPNDRILLFTETAGFRHRSISDAVDALEDRAADEGIATDVTSSSSGVFNDATLAQYDAVVWISTTGNVLNDDEKRAFERFIRAGGGYVGIHGASDANPNAWPWYNDLVGTLFANHPSIQQATIDVEVNDHPSTEQLDSEWVRTDEWYNFRENPRSDVTVLMTLDEDTYNGGSMGSDHPIAWYHDFEGGRSFYSGGGHTSESYEEPLFIDHLWGGIVYAADLGAAPTGDVDGSGQVDNGDVQFLLDTLAEANSPAQFDQNGDGELTVLDALVLAQLLAAG